MFAMIFKSVVSDSSLVSIGCVCMREPDPAEHGAHVAWGVCSVELVLNMAS